MLSVWQYTLNMPLMRGDTDNVPRGGTDRLYLCMDSMDDWESSRSSPNLDKFWPFLAMPAGTGVIRSLAFLNDNNEDIQVRK